SSATPPCTSPEVTRLKPRFQWYWACSGSTVTARSDLPCQLHASASTGITPNQIAANAMTTASTARTQPPEENGVTRGIGDDSASAARTPAQALPASSQHAPIPAVPCT